MNTLIKGTFPVRFRRDGKDGVGINSVNTYYALGDSLTVSPSDSKYIYDTLTDVVISTNSGSYVWSGDKIMYTNGNASLTGKYCIGKCSELASVTEQYGTSSSATAEPTSWSDSYPTSLSSGIYIWTRDKIVWKNNTITHSTAKKAGYIAKDGELGFGFVASVERNGNFSEAEWNDTYGKTGHNETWVNTSSIRNGCRVGDIFQVIGYASDTLNMHTAYYRSTTASDNLTGTCISHSVAERGQQGSPGEDAYSYRLTSQISSIPLNNDGTPSITSFWLQAYIYKGSTSQTVTSSYKLRYEIWRAGQTSCSSYGQGGTNGKLSVSVNSSYTDIVKISCYFKDSSGTVLDSFDILPVKAGAAGVSYFPNMRGVWDGANVTYKWTNGSRDMVTFYVGGTPYLFAVKTAGTTISANVNNATPDKDSRWEKADSPFSMLFANFVYTDNASVAGFVWSDLKMKSPNGKLILNGNTGEFVANKATIRGEVNATSGTFGNCAITNTCRIHQTGGNGWFLVGAQAPSEDKPNGEPSWWLGYSGVMVGSFSMEVSNPSNSSMKSSLHITPNIPSSTITHSNGILRIDSIYQTLASFNQDGGMSVQIGSSIGEGLRFVKNASNNSFNAFLGDGHGCLKGVVQGYQINNTLPSNGVIDLSYGNTVYCAKQGGSITLPTSTNCGRVLGTKGAFAIDLTIIAASGASNFKVYGKSDDNNTDCYLLDNNHANNWNATMSQGDVLQLKLIYTGAYFYAYIVSFKQ